MAPTRSCPAPPHLWHFLRQHGKTMRLMVGHPSTQGYSTAGGAHLGGNSGLAPAATAQCRHRHRSADHRRGQRHLFHGFHGVLHVLSVNAAPWLRHQTLSFCSFSVWEGMGCHKMNMPLHLGRSCQPAAVEAHSSCCTAHNAPCALAASAPKPLQITVMPRLCTAPAKLSTSPRDGLKGPPAFTRPGSQ